MQEKPATPLDDESNGLAVGADEPFNRDGHGKILPNLQLLCDTFISISYNIAEWTLEQTYLKEYSCKQPKPTGM